jgi:multicomponent Na+:H+ antiporter subunit D
MGRSRLTAFLFLGAALMLLGMPPSPIFWGKYFLFSEAGGDSNWLLVALLLIGTLLEAGYIGKVLWRVMKRKEGTGTFKLPWTTGIMALIVVLAGVVLGSTPGILQDILYMVWLEFVDPVFLSGGVI